MSNSRVSFLFSNQSMLPSPGGGGSLPETSEEIVLKMVKKKKLWVLVPKPIRSAAERGVTRHDKPWGEVSTNDTDARLCNRKW